MKHSVLIILLLALALGAFSILNAQVTVILGEGTATNTETGAPTPYGTYFKNFHQQYLVLASELEDIGGGEGPINSLAFNVQDINTCSPMPNFTISLKPTTQTELTTTFETGDYTEVFFENNFMPVNGWNTHTFSTPFDWDGSSNLIVDIITTLIDGTYTRNASVYFTPTTFNSCLRYHSDSADAASSTTGTLSVNRANMQFNMAALTVTDPPNPAQIVFPADGQTEVSPFTSLNWISGGGAPTGYKLNFGTNTPPSNMESNLDLQSATSYTPDPELDTDTTYYWQIVPYNAIGDATNCPIWSFSTHGEAAIEELPYAQNWDTVTPPELPFDWSTIVQSTNPAALVATNTTLPNSAPNNVRMYNASDTAAELLLISPEIDAAIPMHTIRVKAWLRSTSTSNTMQVGVMTNPTDPSTFELVQTESFANTTYSEHSIPLSSYSGTGRFIAFRHGVDGSSRNLYVDDIMLEEIAPNDLAAVALHGNATPSVGVAANYTVDVFNNGTVTQNTYTVKLMDIEGNELGSVAGTSLPAGETAAIAIPWTPSAEGPVSIYGKVILAGDVNTLNDETAIMDVSVQPEGVFSVTIGEGDELQGIPWEFFYKNSLFQTLYYEAEMGMFGSITAISFYNDFTTNLTAMPVKLWLGSTTAEDLSAGWIDPTTLILVYDGTMDFPNGANTITIPLQVPYTYAGGNLVLYANRPMDTQYYSSSDNFLAQTVGTNRARKQVSDSIEYDPMAPSAAGTLSGTFPKTTFMMAPLSDDPLFVVNLSEADFGTVLLGSTGHQDFFIANAGGGTLGINEITISGDPAFSLSDDPDLPASLTTGQTLIFGVDYSPTAEGTHTAQVSITDNVTREVHTIQLTGTGLDATIYELAYTENWDSVDAPAFPLGWTPILEATSTSAYLRTSTTSPNSPPNCVQMANSSDAAATIILVSPLIDDDIAMTDIRVRVMAKGSTNYLLQVGTIVDPTDPSTFELAQELTLSSAWDEYTVNLTGHTGTGHYVAFRHGLGSTYRTIYLDDIVFEEIAPNDLAALAVSGNSTPPVNTETQYTIDVFNNGTADQSDYLVKLFDGADTELASVAGPAIAAGEIEQVTLNWTPTVEGPATIYGKVVLAGDVNPTNDTSPAMAISVQPEGMLTVTIGDGTENEGIPWEFYYKNSLFQTLYYPQELGIVGTITTVAFYNNFSTNLSDMPIKLWLGTTILEDLSAGWVDPTSLTLVYDGTMDFPNGANTITIPLQVPYTYVGGNLVLYANRPMDTQYYSSSDNFLAQTVGTNRARKLYSDGTEYDPMAPSADGTLSGTFPKTTFIMTPLTGDPVFMVSPSEYDFGDVNLSGTRTKTFSIMNVGGGNLGINEITIDGSPTMTLTDIDPLPASLETGAIANFTVSFTPTMLGEVEATVTITDDQGTRHQIGKKADPSARSTLRETHTVNVSGNGVNEITIGDGSSTARMPMDFYYRNSLYETIFTAAEMGDFVGMITGIKFYNDFSSDLTGMPVKIWLGSTTQTDLTAGWIPATDLTLVFDGAVDFPAGQNIIEFELPEYYMHLDGGNLVMMVNRPMDTDWYSSSDKFRTQSGADNRARNFYSDSTECDPTAPVEGSTTAIYPMTTFVVIPGGVGDISGTVTGDNDEPLSDVTVTVNGRPYSTTTDDNGEFFIANVLPGDYVVSFSKYTYISQTVNITLEEDETEIMNISLELMPQVSVTGTILASDTGLGIAGANIHLIGYADYSMSSVADGSFSNSEVFANQSYEYIISASGYTSTSGTITVGNTDYDMGTITLTEIAYAPNSVEAELNDSYNAVNISWNAPDPNAMEITESFEATAFPPQDWTQSITNDGPANTLGIYPTWCNFGTITIAGSGDVSPTEGIKQAGLWWDYSHQDEWLITPSFNCPPDAHLSFDTYLHMGSPNNDHYYVKVSTNEGSSWNILWDGAAQPEALNNYDYLITVGLEEYGGMQVQLAFHADDPPSNEGLWFPWFIDNVYIGNFVDRIEFEPTPALTDIRDIAQKAKSDQHTPDQPARAYLSGQNALSHAGSKAPDKNIILPASRSSHRSLEGYQVWRLISGQEQNENNWVSLTDEIISNLNFTDESWNTLANGTYRWAVKAIYTADVSSVPAFSNPLVKEVVSGNIVGFVRKENGQGIPNATVTASGGFSANTNSAGAYSLTVPAGVYTVTASAASYDSLSYENITVAPSQNTTLNFILEPTSNGDELIPVTVTALNPNYPNPFNPETTISYDIKEAGEVRLDIYNLKGQLVRTLVDKAQVPGRYRIVFDSRDNKGNPLSSGIYLYRLQTKDYQSTRKMMLMQ